jgi:[ribosomal protein S5]-alanine N-acetyltransferase
MTDNIPQFHPPANLSSYRLRFRRVTASDAPLLFSAWTNDAETVRYLQWERHQSLVQTESFVNECVRAWDAGEKFYFVVHHIESDEAVGFASVRVDERCRAGAGFIIFHAHRGLGYASELVAALGDWALAQTSIYRFYGLCDLENTASMRVMERAGMQREGILRRWGVHPNLGPEPRDVFCFTRIK